jgi:polyisoprenoid-binding protein YceI
MGLLMKTSWKIDPAHTDVLFSAKHMMVTTVRGTFSEIEGELELDEANPLESRGEIRIAIESVSTGNAQRDAHLRSSDFFLGEEHPRIIGRVAQVERHGDDYQVIVDLTVRGVTKSVVFDAEFDGIVPGMRGGRHVGFTLRAKINRLDWGINWNVALGGDSWLVGNEVKLEIEVAADEVVLPEAKVADENAASA